MNFRRPFLVSLVLGVAALVAAQEPALTPPAPAVPETAPAPKKASKFVFQLLPKSLQKAPSLDFHVITEMTPEGRKLTPPTASHPVYYLEQAGKFTQLGNNVPGGEHAPPIENLNRAMQRALAESNYVPATPSSPLPALAVVFNFGSFARFSTDADDFQQMIAMDDLARQQNPDGGTPPPYIPAGGERSVASLLPIVLGDRTARTDVLQRAELIGGTKFAHALAAALDHEATYEQANGGSTSAYDEDPNSPLNHFASENEKLLDLVEESFSSCYFVVASAYDYVAMKKGQKILLWRTKMTVNSSGISMSESLPTLVVTAGPYLGRDMAEAVTLTKKISREGKVEIGTPTVVEDQSAAPGTTAPPPKKAPPPKP